MADEQTRLQIGHVLFIDVVGYSKLLVNRQSAVQRELNEVVSSTDEFREAEAEGKLIRLPTGDGMALVFRSNPEAPAQCAIEIGRELKSHPAIQLRMGIHSGPVNEVADVNQRQNIAGAGINVAQRVMDCGDAGHILVSKHVAEDLEQHDRWRPLLHELGTCEVKHGVRIDITNLYSDEVGNAQLPKKFQALKQRRARVRWASVAIGLLVLAAIVAAAFFFGLRKPTRSAMSVVEKSIAVLPFENLSEDKANAYFATGIQDEILTRLAKIGALMVISRNSTQQYAARPGNLSEIAHQLAVANIVEGSVQKAGNQVHINVQLIRAATGEHLWAESYDRNLENIFGVEAEVAISVAEALRATLTGVEHKVLEQKPTNNPEAYDAYLRGIALSGEQNFFSRLKAVKPLEEAVRLDPNFAVAWALLARVNSLAYGSNATPTQRAAAQKALETALRLQPDLPEVQMAQAFYQYRVSGDFDGARSSFEQLRPKLPNSADIPEALGIIAWRQGRWDESLVHTDQAIALNPRDPSLRATVARVQQATRDFSAALRSYDEALSIWPDDANLIAGKAGVHQALGQLDQAEALLEKLHPTTESPVGIEPIWHQAVLRRRPASLIIVFQNWLEQASSLPPLVRNYYSLSLGDLQRLSGNVAAAKTSYSQACNDFEQSLKEQPPNEAVIYERLAWAHAGLGDRERALAFVSSKDGASWRTSFDASARPMAWSKHARASQHALE